ncbi:low temperature requirement protein A [Micromonospora acroterricola]|uniref:Low temperature requirement protein A n=1 Tax=Micromonospora acroterricola TaxID=2202421 RepID=A0A317DAX8_9ACTN|nr:low temperature requirement protein A [Micromonospora acroterricola]PWR10836.1 low temperature requirement protein A [Micromonospora acroterricola]
MAVPDATAPGLPARPLRRGLRPVTEKTRVTTEEIFFDLVFVFAFIQVTTLMTAENSFLGVLHGLLVLTLMWWSWSIFAWLGNRVRANYGLSRLVLLAVTPVMFALAVSTREAFTDLPGGLYTPLVFVACFVTLRVLYLALRWYASPALRRRDRVALVTPMLVATALLLAAALLPRSRLDEPTVRIGQVALWAIAVAVDYGVGMAVRVSERTIFSARHWTERHGLIIIVSLGEVLVAIGIAGTDLPNTTGLMVASLLAVVVAGALEWIYFDLSALVGEHALREASPARRVALARDGYSYLHLPMIAGVILLALGLKHTPSLIVAAHTYRQGDPLDPLGRYAMYGGVALFLVAHAAFQWRLSRQVRVVVWPRLVAAAVLLAMLPVTGRISAARTLVWLAVVCLVTAVVEFAVSRGQRRRLRRALAEEAEGAESGRGEPGLGQPAG